MSGSFESMRWNARVHRLDLRLYSHPKEFWGNGVRTPVNSKGKIPSTGAQHTTKLFWSSTSQQHASEPQGWSCSHACTCCHTETEAADQIFCLTQSKYTDTGPTNTSVDPTTSGSWMGSHWSAVFKSLVRLDPEKSPQRKPELNRGSSALEADTLFSRPMRRLMMVLTIRMMIVLRRMT